MEKKDIEQEFPEKDIEQDGNKNDDIEMEDIENFEQEVDFQKNSKIEKQNKKKVELKRVPVPPHRMTPLRNSWAIIVKTLVEQIKLQVKMNLKRKCVEIKSAQGSTDNNGLQRGCDFLKSFMLGFELNDAIAMLRLDDLFIESFEIKDVKNLSGDHLSRCIGRISGEKGKTKLAIENSTKTRIVLAESKIHIMGSYNNLKIARNALCSLILGSPAGKVYGQLSYISKRLSERP